MDRPCPTAAPCMAVLPCCFLLTISVRGKEGAADSEPAVAWHREGKHRAHAHQQAPHALTGHTLTAAVTTRDCRREQLPLYLQTGAAVTDKPADYLLTTAVGYKPYEIRAFLTTFRRHNQAARAVVLVAPEQWLQLREPLCEYARHYGVEFFSLEPSSYYPVVLARFRAYLEVLSSPGATVARNVLMADVRDTLFQGDPFAPAVLPAPRELPHEPGAALPYVLFTEEGDSVYPSTIRSDPYDQAWIRDCFNESVVEVVLDATVVCAGTILGGRNATMAYLQLMSDIAHFTAKESCMTFGVDQGIHNYIVHYLKPRRPDLLHFEALQMPNDESPIYTLGLVDPPRIEVTHDGFAIYNSKGIRPPVVHQVDRKEALKDHLNMLALDRVKRLRLT